MNAVLELEVNSFQKLVKDFACLALDGKLFHRTAPHCSRSYFYSIIGLWQGNSNLIFRISKFVRIKYITV